MRWLAFILQLTTIMANEMPPIDILNSMADDFSCGSIGFIYPQIKQIDLPALKGLSKFSSTFTLTFDSVFKMAARDMAECEDNCFPDLYVIPHFDGMIGFLQPLFANRTHYDLGVYFIQLKDKSTKQDVIHF